MNERLESLDVLRGMDMIWIMGLSDLVRRLCDFCGWGSNCFLALQMRHVTWHGLAFIDTVFPLFLFIAGLTFPFSYAKKVARGMSAGRIRLDILRRVAILFVLGLVYNDLLQWDLRLGSVLGRIGIAWGVAALLYMVWGWKRRLAAVVAILIAYWMLICLVTAPDSLAVAMPKGFEEWGRGSYSVVGNISGWIDRHFVPGRFRTNGGACDSQGVLGHVPAVATALLGMFCGEFVRKMRGKMSGDRQVLWMLGWAAAELAGGLLVAFGFGEASFPVNKKLWSSSFVLVVGAYSTAAFALVYWLVDVRKLWRRTLFFKVIGMNAITIYMAQAVFDLHKVTDFFFGGLVGFCNESVPKLGPVVHCAGYVALCWLILYFLYRRKIFLKV